MPVVLSLLVFTAIAIVLAAVAWARVNGTLGETAQERIDRKFESIVSQLTD